MFYEMFFVFFLYRRMGFAETLEFQISKTFHSRRKHNHVVQPVTQSNNNKKQRHREIQREPEISGDRDREPARQRETQREAKRQRETQRETHRETHRDTHRETQSHREAERVTETHRQIPIIIPN